MRTIRANASLGLAVALVGALVVCGTVQAGLVELKRGGVDSGWTAEWDSTLDGLVDIAVDAVDLDKDAVFIEKAAEFTLGPSNGVFPPIPIVFRQVSANAVGNIVINDEIITNSTGADWTDFHFKVIDGGDAVFDPAKSLTSGGPPPVGFYVGPFTQAEFSAGNTSLDIDGGVVSHEPGQNIWFPGNGAADGQLWIKLNAKDSEPFLVFTLKEIPTPEPATAGSLAAAMLMVAALRRRLS